MLGAEIFKLENLEIMSYLLSNKDVLFQLLFKNIIRKGVKESDLTILGEGRKWKQKKYTKLHLI